MADGEDSNGTMDAAADMGGSGDLVLQLNFVPQWARTPPGGRVYHEIGEADGRGRGRGGFDRDDRRGGGGGERDRRPARPGGRDDRRRDGSRGGGGRGEGHGDDRRRDGGGGGGPRRDAEPRGRPAYGERQPARAPVSVRILPEQHGLASIVRKISHSRRAYPLSEIAYVFLSKPEACNVRIEPEAGQNGRMPLFQCQLCRVVGTDAAAMRSHVVARHMDEFFSVEEHESEPPAGQFVCVARCGLTGTLLGPPNHHSYAAKVQDVHRSRFAHMPFDEYSRRIEMVHDAALVERWKEESRRQRLYTLKTAHPELPEAVQRQAAETFMLRHVVAGQVRQVPRAIVPLPVARTIEDGPLQAALRETLMREDRFPLSLMMALRAAFRHMHLHVFKTGEGRGMNFVTATPPSAMDASHAVEAIRLLIADLTAHPGCTREQLMERLHPGQPADAAGCRDTLSHLSWLIEKGHVIEFFNGTLAVPLSTPQDVRQAPPPEPRIPADPAPASPVA